MKQSIIVFTILALSHICNTHGEAYFTSNKFSTMTGNPALMNQLLNSFKTELGGTATASCDEIPGVGFPILAIRHALQIIDTSLDSTYNHTFAKTIYFDVKEIAKPDKKIYKLVVQVKTIKDQNYIAVEGEYRALGHPSFKVNMYYFDVDLNNVEKVMGVSLDANAYVGCGDVKKIYSQKNPVLPSPNHVVNGSQTHAHNAPYGPGAGFNHEGEGGYGTGQRGTNVDPQQVAAIMALLRNQ
jgi:hypothetical protein